MGDADEALRSVEALRRNGVEIAFGAMTSRASTWRHRLEDAGLSVVETLHEQTAAFAAEAWAKVVRRPGLVILDGPTALPRAMTGVANAHASGSPLVVLDEDASTGDAGGVDHGAMAATVTRSVSRAYAAQLPGALSAACVTANRPPRGPVLVEIVAPSEEAAGPASGPVVGADASAGGLPDEAAVKAIAALLEGAERPVLVAGGNVYWAGAEDALRRFAETLRIPVVMNGMGRGTLPADHHLALSRARPSALRGADLVLVAGTPLDFRLGYGRFAGARVVHLCEDASQIAGHVDLAGAAAGNLALILDGLTDASGAVSLPRAAWTEQLRAEEAELRAAEAAEPGGEVGPIRPPALYRELRRWLARDAVVIGDGGDFVSYAGRFVDTFTPGCFLDPGPYGCLGIGLGYAIGAGRARPDRQVVVLLGDGSAGFSLMEFATLVRYGLRAVVIVGNNDGWGLEKHHMQTAFGYHVVADLAPGTRYDRVAASLGGHGELVDRPDQLSPALERAFASPHPALVNVVLDPNDAYPRSTVLA